MQGNIIKKRYMSFAFEKIPWISLSCKLVPVQYREYIYGQLFASGMDRTFQREDLGRHGFACKIVPEYSEAKQKTFTGCMHRRGTKKFPIKAQSIIPAPSYFKVRNKERLTSLEPFHFFPPFHQLIGKHFVLRSTHQSFNDTLSIQ